MLLGITTDTQDMTGKVLREHAVTCKEEEVSAVIEGFVGEYDQIPPMYSALKVNGQKLCDLARAGIEVERKARKVHIYGIEILSIELPRIKMRVKCSKGTYIRTLCQDIGEKLSCGGCMESLLRTKAADFVLEEAYKLSEVEQAVKEGRIEAYVKPVDFVFREYPHAIIRKEYAKLLYNGNRLPDDACLEWDKTQTEKKYRVYDEEEQFIGIYEWSGDALKPVKIFL